MWNVIENTTTRRMRSLDVFRLATSVPKKLCADLYDLVREDCSGGEFLCVSTVIEWLQRATE